MFNLQVLYYSDFIRNFKINFHVFFSMDATIQDFKVFLVLVTIATNKVLKRSYYSILFSYDFLVTIITNT